MALQTLPTLSPSGYATFTAAPVPIGGNGSYYGQPAAIALPVGSAPDKVLVSNIGQESAFVLIAAPAATDTGNGTAGSTSVTLASGSGVLAGQVVVGAGVAPGTVIEAISGTSILLTLPLIANISSGALAFVTPVTPQSGVIVLVNQSLCLSYVSSGYISALCVNPGNKATLNIAVGV